MKIMLCGGAGYIGSVLTPKLLEAGYEVSVTDLLWFGNQLPDQVEVIQKDIFAMEASDLEGFDQVIFLAGLSNDPMAEFSPKDNFIYNAAAPAYLGYIAKQAKVKRYIYAGSCSVYGFTVNELYDENGPTISQYPYGISKLQGEDAVLRMADDDFSVICFRQGTVSGYSPRMRLDLVVNTMFKFAVDTGGITVNNPAIWRPVLGIQDAAQAYMKAIAAEEGLTGIFNVASGNYTVGEIGELVKHQLEEKMGLSIEMTIKDIEDFRNYKVSYGKAEEILGFAPTHDVPVIVNELIENHEKFSDFDNPAYYNIEVFKNIKTVV
jgi:nucleoside-diphosphate-sugar epimerase